MRRSLVVMECAKVNELQFLKKDEVGLCKELTSTNGLRIVLT
jgi:thymidine kinase